MTRLIAKRQGMDLIIHLDHEPSLDHLETVNGQTNQVWVDLTFAILAKLDRDNGGCSLPC
jgi:hypothetical protein